MEDPLLAQRVFEKSREWGIEHRQDLAFVWYQMGYVETAYSTAIIFTMRINGIDCMIAACSTPFTTNRQAYNNTLAEIVITDPSWMYLDCYQFNGLALWNFQGMTDPKYAQASHPIGNLQDLLDQYCTTIGITDWRQRHGELRGGP